MTLSGRDRVVRLGLLITREDDLSQLYPEQSFGQVAPA
jgi:hypothetical protein